MFGLRRRQLATDVTRDELLSTEQLHTVIHRSVADLFGTNGVWTVARRSEADQDVIFREMFAHSLSDAIASEIAAAQGIQIDKVHTVSTFQPVRLSWISTPVTGWAEIELQQQKTGDTFRKLVA